MYILTEKRVAATKEMLDAVMAKDLALAEFLTTPIMKLPKRYVYLIAADPSEVDLRRTLYDEALFCLERYTASEFSMIGDKVTGFMSYAIWPFFPQRVVDIAMFSCDVNSNNAVLLRDMLKLIKELQKKYVSVQWDAAKNNPANRIYQKLVQKEDGTSGDDSRYPGLICYRLPGTRSLPEKMHFSREYGVWYRYKKDLEEYIKTKQ